MSQLKSMLIVLIPLQRKLWFQSKVT